MYMKHKKCILKYAIIHAIILLKLSNVHINALAFRKDLAKI